MTDDATAFTVLLTFIGIVLTVSGLMALAWRCREQFYALSAFASAAFVLAGLTVVGS